MNFQIYQVDAFTENILGGNPACVVPLEKWFSDDLLLQIAKENAVAETAFFIIESDHIHLRWFTPDIEIDLCGHATLATACVLKKILNYPPKFIRFKTLSGDLKVSYKNDMFFLDLPSRPGIPSELPNEISSALNIQPKEIYKARDYMLVYDSEEEVKSIQINRLFFDKINLGYGGVIATSKGNNVDFVSRFFTPQATILEDPVTGSAHCTLTPYWSSILSKENLVALQLSERGGKLYCSNKLKRVIIGGNAKIFSKGEFSI